MKVKICLLLKKGKKFNKKIIKYFNNKDVSKDIFLGKIGDKVPKKLKKKKYDVIVSYLSPWILSNQILKKTKMYNINFHPGSPKYPGIGCFNFAILKKEKKYGVTMHLMKKKVDSGKIIKVKYFSSKNLSLLNLINKSYEHMYKLFVQEMNYFFKNKSLKFSKEKWKRKAYRRIDLNNLCKLSLKMGKKKFIQTIKAVYHPDYPPPYFIIKGKKFLVIPGL